MDAGKVKHADAGAPARVRMLTDRHGWFWSDWLYAGQEYELPADVAEYLIGVGAAAMVVAQPAVAKPEAKPAPKQKAG